MDGAWSHEVRIRLHIRSFRPCARQAQLGTRANDFWDRKGLSRRFGTTSWRAPKSYFMVGTRNNAFSFFLAEHKARLANKLHVSLNNLKIMTFNISSSFLHRPNMGRGRQIIDAHPKMHITVRRRMESRLKYKPKAIWTPNTEIYLHWPSNVKSDLSDLHSFIYNWMALPLGSCVLHSFIPPDCQVLYMPHHWTFLFFGGAFG